jgi:hypothetical protein
MTFSHDFFPLNSMYYLNSQRLIIFRNDLLLEELMNVNQYKVQIQPNITMDRIKTAVENRLLIFEGLKVGRSEITGNGIVAVKAEGNFKNRNIKIVFYAREKEGQILMKIDHNLDLTEITKLPEPRTSISDDSASFLEFWDMVLQDLMYEGRTDIGKPRRWDTVPSEPAQPIISSVTPVAPKVKMSAEDAIFRSLAPETSVAPSTQVAFAPNAPKIEAEFQVLLHPDMQIIPKEIALLYSFTGGRNWDDYYANKITAKNWQVNMYDLPTGATMEFFLRLVFKDGRIMTGKKTNANYKINIRDNSDSGKYKAQIRITNENLSSIGRKCLICEQVVAHGTNMCATDQCFAVYCPDCNRMLPPFGNYCPWCKKVVSI